MQWEISPPDGRRMRAASVRDQPTPTQVGVDRSSPLPRWTAYARGICLGIALRADELPLCVGRICVLSADRAYALAWLEIRVLGGSV